MRRESTAWAVERWWRHVLAMALTACFPPSREQVAPHGVNTDDEMDNPEC